MLQTYKTNFETFCQRSVFEVPQHVFGPVPSDGEKLAFKVTKETVASLSPSCTLGDDNISPSSPTTEISSKTLNLSLEDTLTVQGKVAEALGLKNVWSLVFLSAAKGCIKLTFAAPRVVMETVKPQLDINTPTEFTMCSRFANLEASGIHIMCGPPGKPYVTKVTKDSIGLQWTKPEY